MSQSLRNFEQVKDVLDYGIDIHIRLRGVYEELEQHSDHIRVKMVLDYLSEHERVREEALHRFAEGTRRFVLDTWLQYAPRSNIEQLLGDSRTRRNLSIDDVMGLAMAFDDAMIDIYRETAREAADGSVREVFENLAEMERRETQRFIRDAEWMQDF